MVPKGNPARVASLTDLARSNIRLAMPNPDTEGITDQIKVSLQKAGGQALVNTLYGTKAKDGSTLKSPGAVKIFESYGFQAYTR